MADYSDSSWPPLGADGYSVEYGRIEPEVYEAAKAIWPEAENFALTTLRDGAAGRTLMMKAAANVSRVYATRPHEVMALKAYLFQAYKHLILAELRKIRLHGDLTAAAHHAALTSLETPADELDKKILIEQLMQAMDPWTRKVFDYLVLGYTFHEIGVEFGMLGASVRNKFNKNLRPLIRRMRDYGRRREE